MVILGVPFWMSHVIGYSSIFESYTITYGVTLIKYFMSISSLLISYSFQLSLHNMNYSILSTNCEKCGVSFSPQYSHF
jgi:hypothetical protein